MAEEQTTSTATEPTAPATAAAAADTKTTETQATDTTQAEEKQFTQADVDAAVEKKLARERRKWEREQTTAQPAAAAEKPVEQKPAAADESAARIAKANAREVMTAAKLAAVSLGVPASRAAYAARMADLSGVEVDDVDGPDTDAVKKAMEAVLKDIPELKPAAAADQKPGLKIGADNSPAKPAAAPAAAGTRIKPWNKFRV